MSDFFERVISLQTELKAPKDKRNTFGGFNYRSCEAILEAVKPLLKKYGILLNLSDEVVEIGGRCYVQATASLFDSKGQGAINSKALAREADVKKGMDPAQMTGASSSYARKYALNGLFCIDDTKDPDTDEFTKQTNRSSKKEMPDTISFGTASAEDTGETEEPQKPDVGEKESVEILGLKSLMKRDSVTDEQVLGAFKGKYSDVENITNKDALSLMDKWSDFIKHIKGGN